MAAAIPRVSSNVAVGRGHPPAAMSLWTAREGANACAPSLPSLVTSSSGSARSSPPTPVWSAATVPSSKPPSPPSPSAVTVLPVVDSPQPPTPAASARTGGRSREARPETSSDTWRTNSTRRSTRRSSSAQRAAASPPTVTLIHGGTVGASAKGPPPRRNQSDMAGGVRGGCDGTRGKRRSSAEERLSAAASDVSMDKTDVAPPSGADALSHALTVPVKPSPAPYRAVKPTPALAIPVPKFVARPAGGTGQVDDWPADVVDRPSSVTSLESLTPSTSTDGAGAKVGLPKAKVFMLRTTVPDGTDIPPAAANGAGPTRLPYDESLGLDEGDDEEDDIFTEVASMAAVSCTPATGFDRALDGPVPGVPKPDTRQKSPAELAPPHVRRYPSPPAETLNRAPRPAPPRSLKPPVPVPASVRPGRPRAPRHYPRNQSRTQSAVAPPPDTRPDDQSGPPQRVCSSSVAALWHGPVSLIDQPPSLGMAALRMESAPSLAHSGPAGGAARRPSGRDWDDEDDVAVEGGGAPPPSCGGGRGGRVAASNGPGHAGPVSVPAVAAAPVDAKTRYHKLRWWKNKVPAGNRQSDAATRRAAAVLHSESRRPAGQGRGSIVDAACQVSMMADDFIEFATGGKFGGGGKAGGPAGGARKDGGRTHRLLVRPLRWIQRTVQPVQSTQRIMGG